MISVGEIMERANHSLVRMRREGEDLTLEEKAEICSELELQQKYVDIASNIIGDLSSLPIAGKIAGTIAAAAMTATHVASGRLDIEQTLLGCSDLPFDQIKEVLENRFNEIDRKLDSHSAALEEITKLVEKSISVVEKTRKQMNKRFDEVMKSIQDAKVSPIISKINNFARYFDTEKERIRGLKLNDYILKLEEPNGILLHFKESRTPTDDSLQAPLFSIIEEGYAVPKSIDDELAFKVLYALLYGTQTYVSVMFFLLEQYSFLANHYYEKGYLEKYDEYFNSLNNVFLDFKSSLVGTGTSNNEGLLDRVLQVLMTVKNSEFLGLEKNGVDEMLNEKINLFNKIKEEIEGKQKMTLSETPENFAQISFDKDITTPIGDWRDGREVRYAVQYASETLFSKISHWSDPVSVREKACPTLRMPVDQTRRNVLVFRKFDSSKPQLVGEITPYLSNFIDIDRDLYNAASNPDSAVGFKEFTKLNYDGANIRATFDHGRTVFHAAAKSGNDKIMFGLTFLAKSTELNQPDKKGYTPIHVAADSGNAGIVNLLIQRGVSINSKTYHFLQTPLHLAAQRGFVTTFQRLMESPEININERDKDGFTPLHYAIRGGERILEAFLNQISIDVNAKSNTGLTPFHLAIIKNDWPVASTLLGSKKVDINAVDENNITALHYAAILGYLETTKQLINLKEINANVVSSPGLLSALHYAILYKHDDVASFLMRSSNVNVNLKALGGITPLHLAVIQGRKQILSLMFDIGVNIEQKTDEKYTPLHLAAMSKYPELIQILLDQGSNFEAKTNSGATPLHLATFKGKSQAALILLNNEVNWRDTDENGQMPIHGAAMTGLLDVAQAIISIDATVVDIEDKNSDTPLNLAAQNSHIDVIKYFIDQGADINTRNKKGLAPLLAFSKKGNLDMVKYLFDKNANVYIADNDGMNFFYYAVQNGHLNIVKYAMSEKDKFEWSNTDNNRRDECPNEECAISHFAVCDAVQFDRIEIVKYFVGTLGNFAICGPLHQAARYGHLDIVKYLVEEEFLSVDGSKTDTPLCYASENGHFTVVQYLVSNGAKVNHDCGNGMTAIDKAITKNHLQVVQFLAANGVDFRRKNSRGTTPFLTAVAENALDIAEYLIREKRQDININEQNVDKDTALHLAVYYKNLQMIKLLIKYGIDVTIRNAYDKTALDIAIDAKFSNIVEYLKTKSGKFRREYKSSYGERSLLQTNQISNFIDRKNIEHDHPLFINADNESSELFSKTASNIDVIGTLLLIDVLIRYFSKQGYISKESDSASDGITQAAALSITEKFEDVLNSLHNESAKEQVDLAEVHGKVYAALKSGRNSQIHQILCSSLNSISTLKPEDMEKLESVIMNSHSSVSLPEVTDSANEAYGETLHLFGESCLHSDGILTKKLM
nr:alpha latrotoxin [Latrodectus tredecimguttatus]